MFLLGMHHNAHLCNPLMTVRNAAPTREHPLTYLPYQNILLGKTYDGCWQLSPAFSPWYFPFFPSTSTPPYRKSKTYSLLTGGWMFNFLIVLRLRWLDGFVCVPLKCNISGSHMLAHTVYTWHRHTSHALRGREGGGGGEGAGETGRVLSSQLTWLE